MLGFFRGKGKRKENKNENIIYTPCKGTVVPITEKFLILFFQKRYWEMGLR